MEFLKQAAILLFTLTSVEALAHGGGLNAEGCHNDRKRGGYHCHNGNSQPKPTYRSSIYQAPRPISLYTPTASITAYDDQVEIVQKMLLKLGYETGIADGILGSKTEQAITNFQQKSGMLETGSVDMSLIDALIEKLAE